MDTRKTPQLADDGEDGWPVKLHIGCGGVYLRGYLNMDCHGKFCDRQPPHATTPDDYYAGLVGSIDHIPKPRQVIIDRHYDMVAPYVGDVVVNKILALQCLEHVSYGDARYCLGEWCAALRPGGVLVLSVPDTDETLEMLARPETHDFALRHLAGTHKGPEYWHKSHWTHDSLLRAMREVGFKVSVLPNPHFYPAVCVRGVK
jgi:hypothetical protein